MIELAPLDEPVAAAIGWFYLATNSARVLTYVPQIVAVWRCTDGARAISLLTWGSWMIANVTAVAYGVLVVHDEFFVAISAINLTGCSAVTLIAARRRRDQGLAPPAQPEAAPIAIREVRAPARHPRMMRPRKSAARRTRASNPPAGAGADRGMQGPPPITDGLAPP